MLCAAVLAVGGLAAGRAWGDDEVELGQRVYELGEGEEGREIIAALGDGGTEVPARTLPCASCHGQRGEGGEEGGVRPSALTWDALTRPYEVDHPSGRSHPPYTERLLKRAVTMGMDPAGQPLHVAMPRYRLTHREAAALVAYLKTLTRDGVAPGVRVDRLRIGVVMPPAGQAPGLGEAVRAVLEAYAARSNARGGIYGRRLEILALTPPAPPAARREALARWLAEEEIFALVSSFLTGADAELAGLAAEAAVPVVAPFTVRPQLALPLNRYVFYLLSGLEDQTRALIDYGLEELTEVARVRLLLPADGSLDELAAAALEQAARRGAGSPWAAATRVPYGPGGTPLQALDPTAGDAVLFLGDEAAAVGFLRALGQLDWTPHVLLLSALSGNAVAAAPARLTDHIFVAYPTLPSDKDEAGLERYRALAEEASLPDAHLSLQLATLTGMELLATALERSGRQLSREGLVESLEGLYAFDTALSPPLTYGPNRRVGALGAYIVRPDPTTGTIIAGRWQTPR